MALAFDYAARTGLVDPAEARRVRDHLDAAELPTDLADAGLSGKDASRLLAHMGKDKKVRDGRIALILPRRIGEAFVMRDAPAEELQSFLANHR
jgi:3-dehydroquinate synthase